MSLFLLKLSVNFCLLIAMLLSQQSAIPPANAIDYYVTPVLPNPKCPPGQPCFELDKYALNSSQYLSNHDNITLHFFNGDHNLTQELNFNNLQNLSWLGNPGGTTHILSECGASITFNNVSEVKVISLSIESVSNNCFELSFNTHLFQMEDVLIRHINTTVSSEKTIFIAKSTLYSSPIQLWILNSASLETVTVIQNSRLIDSPEVYSLSYYGTCDECQMVNLTVDNLVTNRSVVKPEKNGIGDLILYTTINAQHRMKITNSSFNRSPSTGVMFVLGVVGSKNPTYFSEITIESTTFSQNRLGGMMASLQNLQASDLSSTSYLVEFRIQRCTFINNTVSGTSLQASALTIIGDPLLVDILISGTTFLANIDTRSAPTTVLISPYNLTVTNSLFLRNIGTALKTYNNRVYITGDVQFHKNSAYEGGGLMLVNSYLYLTNNSHLTFINNTAQHVGGGILVKPLTQAESPNSQSTQKCFYQIDHENDNVSVLMMNNVAEYGGDHIYGSSLKSQCSVGFDNNNNYILSYEVQGEVFQFHDNSNSQVSSNPTRVCLCDNGVPSCIDIIEIFYYTLRFPGETFSVSAALVGDDFGITSGTLYIHALANQSTLSITELQLSQTLNKSCSDIEFTIYSNRTKRWEKLVLTPFFNTDHSKDTTPEKIQESISEYKEKGYIPSELLQTPIYLPVYLLPCPSGFILLEDQCQCNPLLTESSIHCAIENRTGYIYRSGSVWISSSRDENGTTNGVILSKFCPNQYCEQDNIPIELDEPNMQCAFNHSGTLCGGCKSKHSLVLGSQRCLICDNKGISLLLFFTLAGFLLVLFIKLLDMTVTQGTINGLIFYANIIWVNQSILFPEKMSLSVKILRIFIAWINLDFGIEICFFNGLDAYWKTWMQFLFPIYLWTIAGVIIVLCRYSTVVTRLFGSNSVSVLATLTLLSYAKLLRTILNIVEVGMLEFQDGHYQLVWALDGNITYIVSRHAPLFCAGLVAFLFLWLPYTMALFLVPWLRAKSYWWCLRWINKLKPFFDANYGSLKDRQHYWIGLLLLLRGFLFIIMLLATTSKISQSANLVAIIITMACLLVHPDPYKKWYVSLLEKTFFANVIIICVGVYHVMITNGNRSVVTITSIGLAIVQFSVIILAHVYLLIHRVNKKYYKIRTGNVPVRNEPNRTRIRGLSGRWEERYQQLLDTMPDEEDGPGQR